MAHGLRWRCGHMAFPQTVVDSFNAVVQEEGNGYMAPPNP